MSIGTNIKKRRYELNISQSELAKAMGYSSKSTIAKIESGENGVSSKKLEIFAKVLNTTVEELVSGVGSAYNFESSVQTNGKKTVAVILAGGKDKTNGQNIPNQFVSVFGKPIIIYSMEAYQKHPAITEIYVVCIKRWEDIVVSYAHQFGITKLKGIIPSGETGILSVKNAMDFLKDKCTFSDTVVFQESTRPLVKEENISKLLLCFDRHSSAVTCGSMAEHLQFFVNDDTTKYIDRKFLIETQSPEAYNFDELSDLLQKAENENHKFFESCCSMFMYNFGKTPYFFEGNISNVKIKRSEDISLFSAYIGRRM